VVTVSLYQGVRVLRVAGFAGQRGSGEAARLLYEELSVNAGGGGLIGHEPA
jgi:hypothetical protein